MQAGFWNGGREKRGPQLKARKAPERSFKPEAAAGLNRNATTSACVGWDRGNIENQSTLRKLRYPPGRRQSFSRKTA